MARSVEALVNADVLRWARNSAGFDLDDAAEKIGVSSDKLFLWEEGSSRPTIKQLFKLSNVYKRPPTAFYLSEVPQQPTLQYQGDYRRLPNVADNKKSPSLVFALRRAEYRRRVAIELYKELDLELPEIPFLLDLDDSVEEGADRVREFLGVPDEVQVRQWRRANDAFNGWREALERVGVLVFQVSRIPISEMRAISIDERPLPYILLNSSDASNGRIFSLLHEFSHIVLQNNEKTDSAKPAEEQRVEVFCNAVASAVLMPKRLITQILEGQPIDKSSSLEFINSSAEALNVSREAFIRRLVTLNYSSEQFYQRMRQQYEEERLKAKEEGRASGGPQYHVQVLNSAGYLFSQLVLSGLSSGKITAKDASDFLGASAKHLPNIEGLVERHKASVGEAR